MLNRSIQPNLPASAYKSYVISAPRSTHFRPATCEEAECPNFLNGWQSVIDTSIDQGPERFHYLTHDRSRTYTVEQHSPTLFTFTYGPGQQCFASSEHQVPVGRPELFMLRGGDFRGNPLGLRPVTFNDPQDWLDSFGEHQERIADQIGRG